MTLRLFGLVRKFSSNTPKTVVARPFETIPGPKGIFGIGNFYNYFKVFGKYSFDELHLSGMKKYLEFGPIVCERMIPGVNILWIYDPNDIAEMFREEPGNFARRQSHMALAKYRKDRPEIYRTAGLLPTNGEEWWKIRSELQKGLSKPQNVRNFLPIADKTVCDFIRSLPEQFDEKNNIDEMLEEISRLNLELTCLIAFDETLNSFSLEERCPESRSSKLIKAADETNKNILPTDQGFQMWRFFETKEYKKIKQSQQFIEEVSIELVAKKQRQLNSGNSLLDQYLKNPMLDVKDLYGMSADLLLAGVHTSSFTTSFALYHISMHQHVQELIYQESLHALPNVNDNLTPEVIDSKISYLRAVLKESLRLNPISVGVSRILNNDKILGGYHVPKDTIVVSQNQISCILEKYFENPQKFIPERWLKNETQKQTNIHPHLVLPFGHGTRSCIARRFAEQNLLVFLLRLIRQYKIEWTGESRKLGIKSKLINEPASKIKLRFEKR